MGVINMARILEQGPAIIVAAPKAVSKSKANDTNMADRGGRMLGVHAVSGVRKASAWRATTVGRGSRLVSESLRNGTATPTRGANGNYRAK
jgi:hypothetical protein